MDEKRNLLLLKGENKTYQVQICRYDRRSGKYAVSFDGERYYTYNPSAVEWMREPEPLNPALYQVSHNGKPLTQIAMILEFRGSDSYWHIVFRNGRGHTFKKRDLQITKSCLSEKEARDKLSYLKAVAAAGELKTETGESLLSKSFDKLTFVGDATALAAYLDPDQHPIDHRNPGPLIFPFGGNTSQFKAVEQAMSNQLSVIQGPPGTGKTQTILNIIANLLIRNQTVEVVSNNNAATENILEKMSKPQNGLGFLVAALGKTENKKQFLENQSGVYPAIDEWKLSMEEMTELIRKIRDRSAELSEGFVYQEQLACAKQKSQAIKLEKEHFDKYCAEQNLEKPSKKPRRKINPEKILELLQAVEMYSEQGKALPIWTKLKLVFQNGLFEWKFLKQNPDAIIAYLQSLFYQETLAEAEYEVAGLEKRLENFCVKEKMQELTAWSMKYLKGCLYHKYGDRKARPVFPEEALWKTPWLIPKEYPVILSTTFSSCTSLAHVGYDYVIMDEASQVDIATGALSLSCAHNAVIVGDLKQLPNVVTEDVQKKMEALFSAYRLPKGYGFTGNSFLKSVCAVVPEVPQTLLREHYRCHPQIIGFCNQKFYDNQLLIMTEDHGEKDTLQVFKTVEGNHQRGHFNQRELDVTLREALPHLGKVPPEEIGIIAPYREQVKAVSAMLPDERIEADTVHKFQGREKSAIIITTVDDQITEFSGDPYLLNVAVSRAKDKLCLVTSGNEQTKDSNIRDLISYIQYHNFEVTDSKIYSVFDLLYRQYTRQRVEFLRRHRNISEYDSENIMYGNLMDLLKERPDLKLKISCHYPLRQLLRHSDLLTDEEFRYAFHVNTHLDFLIYSQITGQPVLAIEVDGVKYHKEGTRQHERDLMKNKILDKYGIRLLRLPTNGSGEMEKVRAALM